MITDGHLSLLKGIADQAMPDTALISSVTVVSDGMGGQTETEVPQASTVTCRVDPAPSDLPMLKVYANRIGDRVPYFFVCPIGTTIETGNRVVVTNDPLKYEVLAVFQGHSYQIHKQCLIVAVD